MKPFLTLLLLLVLPLPATAQFLLAPRQFDIVPPDGMTVEMVDGQTVLRRQGERFGTVLTFMTESGVNAWVPIAVLNSGNAPIEVGTSHISASYGSTPLKVWSTTALVREAKRRRDEAIAAGGRGAGMTMGDRVAFNTSPNGANDVGRPRRRTEARDNDEYRARQLAQQQFEALRESLFQDQELAPGQVARGDVRIELPPRHPDGRPAEFVLRLDFGGETMDVRYRERIGDVDVGAPEATADAPATPAESAPAG